MVAMAVYAWACVSCPFLWPGPQVSIVCHLATGGSPSVIGRYGRYLEAHGPDRVPRTASRFLQARLARAPSRPEAEAIARFYASGRQRCQNTLLDELGRSGARNLLQGGEALTPEERFRVLAMVEGARLGRCLYKPSLFPAVLGGSLLPRASVERAYGLYAAWVATEAPWPVLRRADPLAGSGLVWVEP